MVSGISSASGYLRPLPVVASQPNPPALNSTGAGASTSVLPASTAASSINPAATVGVKADAQTLAIQQALIDSLTAGAIQLLQRVANAQTSQTPQAATAVPTAAKLANSSNPFSSFEGPPSSGNRASYIMQWLMRELGLTKEQAAGVVGNFKAEAGEDLAPNRNEGGLIGSPAGTGGYGLAQWTASRQSALVAFAKARGKDAGDLDLQLEFAKHELQGPENKALVALKNATTAADAAVVFERKYERAGVPAHEKRVYFANKALQNYSAPTG